jgi:two-component system, LytTR family, sensor kinase
MVNWINKYKLYHIPFWIAYHLLWMIINIGNSTEMFNYLFGEHLPIKFIGYIIFQALGAYFALYFLIPKYLNKGKYLPFIIGVLITIFITTGLITAGYFLNAYWTGIPFEEMFEKKPSQWFEIYSRVALPSTVGSMTLAMSLKLAKNWVNAEKRRLVLEKENVETELKYLKSQINPHFLFNTINSIFVLIHKNPDLASESLASFSELLRYQLYECNEAKTPLIKDLQFLENFIELESLRLNENQTELNFDIDYKNMEGKSIGPFFLLPFVENAFKHVSKGKTQHNFINMKISIIEENKLELHIENSKDQLTKTKDSGIGLVNAQRRLNLVYPNKHTLKIDEMDKAYNVSLIIDLS